MVRIVSVSLLAAVATLLWVHRFQLAEPTGRPSVDATDYYLPAAVFAHEELRNGRLPLWNPYEMAGQPTLALHAPAVLYPPNLMLLFLLPPAAALVAHTVLHLFLAGLFAWLLAGRLGLGAPARVVAGAGYLFSHSLLLGAEMPPFLSTPVWLPLILWATHGLVSEVRARWAIALGAAVGVSFLGGHAQAWLYCVQITGLFAIFGLAFLTPAGSRRRALALTPLAGMVAFAVAAPQLLPALELARSSVRGMGGLSLEVVGLSYTTPRMVAFGWAGPIGSAGLSDFVVLPALALPVALCGLMAPGRRALFFFCLAMTVLLGLFAAGNLGPVFAFYYELPLGNLFRAPWRILFAYHLFTALLLALGVDAIGRRLGARGGPRCLPATAVSLLAALLVLDGYRTTELGRPHPGVEPPARLTRAAREPFLEAAGAFERVFLLRTAATAWPANRKVGSLLGVFAVPGYEPNMPDSYRQFLGVPPTGLWHGDLLLAGAQRGAPAAAAAVAPERFDLMSVGLYVTHRFSLPSLRSDLTPWLGGKQVRRGNLVAISRPAALPRSYAVRRARSARDLDEALRLLDSRGFKPRIEAVVTGRVVATPGGRSADRDGSDRVEITRYTPQRVELTSHCGRRCLAILTDLHYPGWKLRVDGEPRSIERVNGIFRGVWLEPGDHRLVYRYEPASLRAGLAILGFTALGLLAGVAYSARRRRGGSQAVR